MAVATMRNRLEDSPNRRGASSAAIGLRDRAKEFARAQRHSWLVSILKLALPLAAAGILSLYMVPAFLTVRIDGGKGVATVKAVTIEAGSLKMLNPRVKGVNDQQGAYDIVADSATQASKDADTMFLDKVRGQITSQQGQVTVLTAPDGIYNNRNEEITFNNGALVTREPGMTANFETATAYMKQHLVISKTPVVVRLHESTIHAQQMTLYSSEQRAIFEGNVKTHIERKPAEGTAQPAGQ